MSIRCFVCSLKHQIIQTRKAEKKAAFPYFKETIIFFLNFLKIHAKKFK